MKYLLMIPGPVEIPDEIFEASQGQPVAHYGPEWTKQYLDTAAAFSRIIGSSGMTFIMPGSGSLGLDTVGATFCSGKRCLVLHNGMFGERLRQIASRHAEEVQVLEFDLHGPVDPARVKEAVHRRNYDAVLMTHVETSTGILNPVYEVGEVLRGQDGLFILDAISSAGVEKLEMDAWSVDVTVTASQKGLECPAGLALVTAGKDHLERRRGETCRTWYTNLLTWLEYHEKWHDWHPFPVTLPTATVTALSTSLRIMEAEGMESRQRTYLEASSRFRGALRSLGLELFAPEEHSAHGLTAVSSRGLFSPGECIEFLKEELGIQITGSFGELADHVFRIGHMSRKQCSHRNLLAVISGIYLFMQSKGLDVSFEGVKEWIGNTC
jgi:aspartate aminotransferase-like enzyme